MKRKQEAIRLERTLEQELAEHRARRLAAEGRTSELAYVPVTLAAAGLAWPWAPHVEIVACVATSLAAVGLRAALRLRAIRRGATPQGIFRAVRAGVLIVSATWALAIIVIGFHLPPAVLAWMAAIFIGLVAAGSTSLLPDPRSFYTLTTLLLGGLTISVLVSGGPLRVVPTTVIVIFAAAMILFYRRSHAGLVEQLRTSKRLELSERMARDARLASERLERVVEATTDHVLMATADGRLTYMNPAGRTMLGLAPDEDVRSLTFFDITPPATHDEIRAQRLPALMTDGQWIGEGWLRHRDGHDIPVSTVAQTHRDAGGTVESISAIARDMTEQLAARSALQQARDAAEGANAAKSAFLANTSHEIRTPLNGILGMVELLQDTDLTAEQRRNVDLIATSGETLLHTINDVLDISKIEAGQLELENAPFDLPQLVHSVARLFAPRAAAHGVELIADVAADLPSHVLGDAHRLRQVLANLVGNAVKFTSRGEIVVSASVVPGAERYRIRLSVRDSGIGIPASHLEMIFQPFSQVDVSTTRQYGGTGLGLSIARRLVGLMGGDLQVTSEEGKGTEFHFVLPLEQVAERSVAPESVKLPRGTRVLVVDDHPVNRRIGESVLQAAGASVGVVADADTALVELRGEAAGARPYTLVITDVHMPGRDGFELVKAIRADETLRGVAIVILTSGSRPGDAALSRQLGANGYMEKPASRAELLDAAAAALSEGGAFAQGRAPTIRPGATHLRVLIAEDNPINQEVAASMLRKRGHRVEIAASGLEAIAAVREHGRFDVILMDLQMPELGGIEATQHIRTELGNTTPIIALTANLLQEERSRCMAAGMNGFLSKPFKAQELFQAIESIDAAPTAPVPSAPPPDAAPPVDLVAFREGLAEAGIEEIGDAILRLFLQDAPARLAALRTGIQAADGRAVETAAHGLKSACGNVRARRLAELLGSAEQAGRTNAAREFAPIWLAIQAEYDRVSRYLLAVLPPGAPEEVPAPSS